MDEDGRLRTGGQAKETYSYANSSESRISKTGVASVRSGERRVLRCFLDFLA